MPLVFWLYFTTSRAGYVVRALINMPLVLPPVVIGFYLLLAFSPNHAFGRLLYAIFHTNFVFTFEGLVVASVLFNAPFMVNPILSGLEGLPRSLGEASFMLGRGRSRDISSGPSSVNTATVLTGVILTVAHTIGEFGMVLMIGGKIPGVTRVASVAVYDDVESLNFASAHVYSAVSSGRPSRVPAGPASCQ